MTRLIMIRHGETNWNVEQRKQGRNDQPLNEKGQAQAQLAADYAKATFNITKVWSSPLQRCESTAASFDLPVATSEHLLEIDYGNWEGMLDSEIAARQPEIGQKLSQFENPRSKFAVSPAGLTLDYGHIISMVEIIGGKNLA